MSKRAGILGGLLSLGVSLAGLGCSSGGAPATGDAGGAAGTLATGGTGGGAGADGGFINQLHWTANGVAESASFAEAVRVTSTASDSISIVSSDPPLSLTITATGAPLGGTYDCAADGGSKVAFAYQSTATGTAHSCSVTIAFETGADGHQHATGTFSAVLSYGDAGTTVLTAGVFDIVVIRLGG
jgi:hypothetical protein